MLYFIQAGKQGEIKIGVTANPQARVKELQTGNAATLRLLAVMDGGVEKERELHRRFAAYRVDPSREWFRPVTDLLAYIVTYGQIPFMNSLTVLDDGLVQLEFYEALPATTSTLFAFGAYRLHLLMDQKGKKILGLQGKPSTILAMCQGVGADFAVNEIRALLDAKEA